MSVPVIVVGSSSSIGACVVPRLAERGQDVFRIDRREGPPGPLPARASALLILSGLCLGKALSDYTGADFDEVLEANLADPMRMIQLLLPRLERPGGRVLLMSSIAARGSFDPVYAASKAGLHGFVRSMAQHSPGVRFNALAPGLIEGSGMWQKMPQERRAEHIWQTPTGRLIALDEVAGVIVDLLTSPAWASLNGQVLPLDGGRR